MHDNYIKKLTCLAVTAACLLSGFTMPVKAESTRRTIRVGLRSGETANDTTEDSPTVAFDKQYLQAVAEYANWDYTYVYGTWSEVQQMAKNGEVDVLLDVTKNDERAQYLDFSDDAMGNEICYLIGRTDTNLYYNDYSGFNGLKIGYEAGSTMIDSLSAYSKQTGFTYQAVEYPNGLSMFEALDDGEIDAVVQTNFLEIPDGHVILAKCSSLPVYIATTKNIPELKSELDHAMTQLISYEPNFNTILYQKVFSGSSAMIAGYTKEETAYLNTNPIVYVEYETDWKPFEYQNNGEPAGITPDVIRAISKETGITFKFVNAASTKEIYETMGDTSSDLVMAVSYDYIWANDHDLLVTQPYVNGSIMRVTKSADVSPKTAAVAEGGYLASQIEKAYPQLEFIPYDTFDECIAAVAQGKADCAFLNYYQANYYRALVDYSSLTFQPVENVSQSIALGITKESNPILLDILSKSLQRIQDNELQSILSEDTVISEPASVRTFVKHYPVASSVIVSAFMILLAILLITVAGSKARQRRNLALAQTKQEAESANKAKSEFLASMSHDIRTPLNAIIGMTNMAVSSIDDKKQALEDMTIVTAASKHLLSLVNDVLDLSKIESGRMVIAQSSFILPDLIIEIEKIA
jgi:ABC-type amino acid transport substrate-binding protein